MKCFAFIFYIAIIACGMYFLPNTGEVFLEIDKNQASNQLRFEENLRLLSANRNELSRENSIRTAKYDSISADLDRILSEYKKLNGKHKKVE